MEMKNGKQMQAASPDTRQTPLEFFEHHGHEIWASDMEPKEKAVKLTSVSASIRNYVSKVRSELSTKARTQDPWTNMACSRATVYLEGLAEDLSRLAAQCQQAVAGSKAS